MEFVAQQFHERWLVSLKLKNELSRRRMPASSATISQVFDAASMTVEKWQRESEKSDDCATRRVTFPEIVLLHNHNDFDAS
jgi:hypothetical protein